MGLAETTVILSDFIHKRQPHQVVKPLIIIEHDKSGYPVGCSGWVGIFKINVDNNMVTLTPYLLLTRFPFRLRKFKVNISDPECLSKIGAYADKACRAVRHNFRLWILFFILTLALTLLTQSTIPAIVCVMSVLVMVYNDLVLSY